MQFFPYYVAFSRCAIINNNQPVISIKAMVAEVNNFEVV